uniref:Uncharacterized protein n=1 Tax=Physcomitrium patens TaxID=3218 RepID=A0A2K1J3Q9_PHYPA|nr:hypothetical protein PHYPA_022009 [Physcomitrium patens]
MEEISKLSVEQVDGEASVLQESLANIRTAATRFEMPSRAVDALSQQSAVLQRSFKERIKEIM